MRGYVVEDAQAFSFILLGVGLSSGLALRRSRERVRRAEAAGAEALRAQRAFIAHKLHDTLARTNIQIVLWARQARALGPPDERVAQALDEIIAAGCSSVRDLQVGRFLMFSVIQDLYDIRMVQARQNPRFPFEPRQIGRAHV